MTVDELARLRQVLGAFYKTVDVMKSARKSPDGMMNIWADDMKAVEDVMSFLEQLRDTAGDAQGPTEQEDARYWGLRGKVEELVFDPVRRGGRTEAEILAELKNMREIVDAACALPSTTRATTENAGE